MTQEERALKVARYLSDHGYGDCHCDRCLTVGRLKPSTEILRALRQARAEGMAQAKDALLLAHRHLDAIAGRNGCDVWLCEKSARYAVEQALTQYDGEDNDGTA